MCCCKVLVLYSWCLGKDMALVLVKSLFFFFVMSCHPIRPLLAEATAQIVAIKKPFCSPQIQETRDLVFLHYLLSCYSSQTEPCSSDSCSAGENLSARETSWPAWGAQEAHGVTELHWKKSMQTDFLPEKLLGLDLLVPAAAHFLE